MNRQSGELHGLYQIMEASASGKTICRARIPDDKIAVGAGWSFNAAARDLAIGLRKQAEWIEAWIDQKEADASPTGKPPADQEAQ
jgi:hypothetical protein